jgi:hypothetical protein
MKKIVLRYGTYSAIFEFIFFVIVWLIIGNARVGGKLQGAIGYVTILCPLIFVYFGIRYYRDQINNGSITFLNALKIGMLIVIIPTLSFAIIETIYVLYIDPKFYEKVGAYQLAIDRKTLSPAAFAAKLKQVEGQWELYKNPIYNFLGMVLTVGFLGTIVTLISSVLLMRKAELVKA